MMVDFLPYIHSVHAGMGMDLEGQDLKTATAQIITGELHCQRDVNRSVAVALGYTIKKGSYLTLDDAIKSVEDAKKDIPTWDTLTNKLFRDYLSTILAEGE